jgi:hypothetical protein
VAGRGDAIRLDIVFVDIASRIFCFWRWIVGSKENNSSKLNVRTSYLLQVPPFSPFHSRDQRFHPS